MVCSRYYCRNSFCRENDGFDEANLKYLDAATGEDKWKTRGLGKGTVMLADGHLIVHSERGNFPRWRTASSVCATNVKWFAWRGKGGGLGAESDEQTG
jgi:hypothetical protein